MLRRRPVALRRGALIAAAGFTAVAVDVFTTKRFAPLLDAAAIGAVGADAGFDNAHSTAMEGGVWFRVP